jgi:hypothetical protein
MLITLLFDLLTARLEYLIPLALVLTGCAFRLANYRRDGR